MTQGRSRRQFLRSSTACIALPALESWMARRVVRADPVAATPKRVVFLGIGYGVTQESWFPDRSQVGAGYELPAGLAPLSRHKADFTVVQGLTNKFTEEAHWGSTFWLTGANRLEGGVGFHNSISADQVAAAALGKDTRFASIQLNGTDTDLNGQGHGPGLSLAWDVRGRPIPGLNRPLAAYHRLFAAEETPIEARREMLAEKRSILDAVLDDARDLQRGLGQADNRKLDEYFQGIRDIETTLSKEEQWQDRPKRQPPFGQPSAQLSGRDEIKLMYDLIVAAFQTDSTRVMTYRQPVSTLLTSLGIGIAPHDMSHYAPGEREEASKRRDLAQSDLLAGLLDRLKATMDRDGVSLFDRTCVVFGSNIRSIHYLDNCPTLIAGGGAGIKLGQHIVVSKDTPLCNAWLTLLRGLGIDVLRHGDSTGTIPGLRGNG